MNRAAEADKNEQKGVERNVDKKYYEAELQIHHKPSINSAYTPKKVKEATSATKGSAVNSAVLATQGDAGALWMDVFPF